MGAYASNLWPETVVEGDTENRAVGSSGNSSNNLRTGIGTSNNNSAIAISTLSADARGSRQETESGGETFNQVGKENPRQKACGVCGRRDVRERCSVRTGCEGSFRSTCRCQFCRECIMKTFLKQRNCPVCNAAISPYSVYLEMNGMPLLKKLAVSIYGSTFAQFGKIGYSSYHFSPTRCWVRFEPAKFSERIDLITFDGRNECINLEVEFQQWTYDDFTREFTAFIDWGIGRTVRGARRWRYNMIFDEGLEYIESGVIEYEDESGNIFERQKYSEAMMYRRVRTSVYPTSVYVPDWEVGSHPWGLVRILTGLYARFGSWLHNVPRWVPWDMLFYSKPLQNIGNGSIHINQSSNSCSYVDLSKAGLFKSSRSKCGIKNGKAFAIQEKYMIETKTLQLVVDFKTHVALYTLDLDETLEIIHGGEIALYVHVRAASGGDVLTEKYSNMLPEAMVPVSTEVFGSRASPEAPKVHFRYRLVNPWAVFPSI